MTDEMMDILKDMVTPSDPANQTFVGTLPQQVAANQALKAASGAAAYLFDAINVPTVPHLDLIEDVSKDFRGMVSDGRDILDSNGGPVHLDGEVSFRDEVRGKLSNFEVGKNFSVDVGNRHLGNIVCGATADIDYFDNGLANFNGAIVGCTGKIRF